MDAFDKLLDESVSKIGVPQIVGQAVDSKGTIILDKIAGYHDINTSATVTEDSVFWYASSTKLITSIAVLQCVERGQIALDDEIDQYLPEWRDPHIVTYNLDPTLPVEAVGPDGKPSFDLRPATKKITVRMLLTHTSGMSLELSEPSIQAWRKSLNEPPCAWGGVLSQALTPLCFEPGTSWRYGHGIEWAGEIVARVNDTSLGAYLEEHVFRPLGISSITFNPERDPSLAARVVRLHFRTPEGALSTDGIYPWKFPSLAEWGGGGLYGTCSDYLSILRDLISPTPHLLTPSTIALLFEPQFDPGSGSSSGLIAHPAAMMSATGLDLTRPDLAECVSHTLAGRIALKDTPGWPKGTLSWGGAANTTWFVNRDVGVAGCVKVNTMPFLDGPTTKLTQAFMEAAFEVAGHKAR